MALTNFPNGVSSFGVPLIGSGNIPIATRNFFVQSTTGSNGNDGLSPETPFSTLAYAITQCVTAKGDNIILLPGHVETVAAAAGVTFASKAGINVIGVGQGSLRPTVNFTATGSTFLVNAANLTFRNILFTGGIDAVATAVVISAADAWFDGCEYRDVTGEATLAFLTTAGADRLKFTNHTHAGAAGAGATAGIAIVGGTGIIIDGITIDGNFSVGAIDIRGTATVDLQVRNVIGRNRNAADAILVDTVTGSTGVIGPNLNARLADNAANLALSFAGATFVYHGPISIVNLAGEIGAPIYTGTTSGFKTVSTDA
jgi:hypothetical protein